MLNVDLFPSNRILANFQRVKLDFSKFRVAPGRTLRLDDWPTKVKPLYKSKAHYKRLLSHQIKELTELQSLLYASNRYALLLIFQAMDAAGKDSAIKHVMSGVNPQGCQVFSFKHPSAEELEHDFLWRTTRDLPERGRIGIFNRSYYEEVLTVRVHPDLLRGESLPPELVNDEDFWEGRYRSITELESHLYRNGTRMLKFFLHLSREEQRQRFLARLKDPDKNWKLNRGDLGERELWKEYMSAYQQCLRATSTRHARWYAVPADDKKNARLIIAETIVEALKELKLSYPHPDRQQRKELKAIRQQLEAERPDT